MNIFLENYCVLPLKYDCKWFLEKSNGSMFTYLERYIFFYNKI